MKTGTLQGELKSALIGIALLLPMTVIPSGAGWAQGLADVTYIAAWTISGSQAYAFVGIDKGYYKEEGISLKVVRSTGSLRPGQSPGP